MRKKNKTQTRSKKKNNQREMQEQATQAGAVEAAEAEVEAGKTTLQTRQEEPAHKQAAWCKTSSAQQGQTLQDPPL